MAVVNTRQADKIVADGKSAGEPFKPEVGKRYRIIIPRIYKKQVTIDEQGNQLENPVWKNSYDTPTIYFQNLYIEKKCAELGVELTQEKRNELIAEYNNLSVSERFDLAGSQKEFYWNVEQVRNFTNGIPLLFKAGKVVKNGSYSLKVVQIFEKNQEGKSIDVLEKYQQLSSELLRIQDNELKKKYENDNKTYKKEKEDLMNTNFVTRPFFRGVMPVIAIELDKKFIVDKDTSGNVIYDGDGQATGNDKWLPKNEKLGELNLQPWEFSSADFDKMKLILTSKQNCDELNYCEFDLFVPEKENNALSMRDKQVIAVPDEELKIRNIFQDFNRQYAKLRIDMANQLENYHTKVSTFREKNENTALSIIAGGMYKKIKELEQKGLFTSDNVKKHQQAYDAIMEYIKENPDKLEVKNQENVSETENMPNAEQMSENAFQNQIPNGNFNMGNNQMQQTGFGQPSAFQGI